MNSSSFSYLLQFEIRQNLLYTVFDGTVGGEAFVTNVNLIKLIRSFSERIVPSSSVLVEGDVIV